MNASELRAVEKPIAAVALDEVPAVLVERAVAYNAAVDAFREAVRQALETLQRGLPVGDETAAGLRTSAEGLVTAREWLLQLGRLPVASRAG